MHSRFKIRLSPPALRGAPRRGSTGTAERGRVPVPPRARPERDESRDEARCVDCARSACVLLAARAAQRPYINVFTDHMAVLRCAYLHIFTGHSLFTIHLTARRVERREVASHTPTPSTAGSKPRVWFTCCCIVSLLPGATSSTCCRRCGRRIRSISPLRCTNAGGVRPDVGR